MKSITVHKLDSSLADALERKAKEEGLSLNKTIKLLLESSLGLTKAQSPDREADFLDLFASWSEEEAHLVNERVREERRLNIEEWER